MQPAHGLSGFGAAEALPAQTDVVEVRVFARGEDQGVADQARGGDRGPRVDEGALPPIVAALVEKQARVGGSHAGHEESARRGTRLPVRVEGRSGLHRLAARDAQHPIDDFRLVQADGRRR